MPLVNRLMFTLHCHAVSVPHFLIFKRIIIVKYTNLHPMFNTLKLQGGERLIQIHFHSDSMFCQFVQTTRVGTCGTNVKAIVTASSCMCTLQNTICSTTKNGYVQSYEETLMMKVANNASPKQFQALDNCNTCG